MYKCAIINRKHDKLNTCQQTALLDDCIYKIDTHARGVDHRSTEFHHIHFETLIA